MSISPFSARPAPSPGERRRARLALLIATVGIAATLLAYVVSPGVRHAVSHAAHSVNNSVGRVLDHDTSKTAHGRPVTQTAHPKQPAAHGKAPASGGAQVSTPTSAP
jgi:hypothetical protein